MAEYKLYCVGASGNSYKVALYLNCAGLDWMPQGIDFAGGVQRDADWRAEHNAMGEVPVFEVAGRRMSQSGAILTWLAEKQDDIFVVVTANNFKTTNKAMIPRVILPFSASPT